MLGKTVRALEGLIYYASAALMLSLTGVILYAVVARYFFNAAPAWSDEVPRVLFLWATYIGIALAARRDKSLKVTFVLERLPPLGRLWLEMFMHVSIFVMLAFLLWYNVPVIVLGRQTKMLATQWPDAIRFWPLSVGCVLIGLYQIRLVLKSIQDYRTEYRAR
jgi:TRAP-type C4-dicarboxylate transport system permease small subunit